MWSKEQKKQLMILQELLRDVRSLNTGSNVLEKLERCIQRSEALLHTDLTTAKPSFMAFLIDEANRETTDAD